MATSAGILLYRMRDALEVLIVHPGGPFWAKKDAGAWSIPKGEFDPGGEDRSGEDAVGQGTFEDAWDAARREFAEELGMEPPPGEPIPLGSVVQKAGKEVVAFALAGDLDASAVVSNTFTMEWPPRSGRQAEFPEVDRAEWMPPDRARIALNSAQAAFVDRLLDHLAAS